ncbi:PP2C family protein-serine/threonine phosphatase [Streptomyces iconiensis]|uniref:PP2C family protein-serine/threonine phosphatase n=1 Tax=Streptomyces iconiensis TaxID=1384038 RepID=A0ABT6ZZA8_9ACTN|nr:PP2C family protein-serine/threonine phosphatase [Streptomyces iconiensis]MDJ1134385.1 PP2C family protein-serine/threonine phosphatase [Streptomyces iconiensis]
MNEPSFPTDGREASPEREPGGARSDEFLQKLDRLALRSVARARHRVRTRVGAGSKTRQVTARSRAGTAGGSVPEGNTTEGAAGGPFAYDDSSGAATSHVAVLPGLPPWIGSVLALIRGSASVLRPEYGSDGAVRDYTVMGANHLELSGSGNDPLDFLGRPLSETRPGARTSGMYDLYAAALARNGPVGTDSIDYFDVVDGTLRRARLRGTVTPLAEEGLLLTNWEPVGESRIARRAQESARIGWAEWDLVTGKVQWSEGMRVLLGLSVPLPEELETRGGTKGGTKGGTEVRGEGAAAPDTSATGSDASAPRTSAPGSDVSSTPDTSATGTGGGPDAGTEAVADAMATGEMPPTVASARDIGADMRTIARMIDPADLPHFEADMERLLAGEEIADHEMTLHVKGEERRVRWMGHARPTGSDTPESVLFAARDITEQERRLRSALSDAERLRQEAAAERRVSEILRKALTPPLPAFTPPWLSVGAAYVPSDSGIGGDWYKCRELPDGRVLVAVGDASGHGVDAASRAVQQRSALAGLAYTDGDPGQLTRELGEVVHSGDLDTTATAVVGHLDPRTRLFRWASAGHPSPILVRDGVPYVLDAEHGLLLGVMPEASYPVNTTQLAPGDLLLLYTDGVVERRGHDLDTGVHALLEAVVRCASGADARAATDCLMSTLLGPGAEDDATILGLHVAWG